MHQPPHSSWLYIILRAPADACKHETDGVLLRNVTLPWGAAWQRQPRLLLVVDILVEKHCGTLDLLSTKWQSDHTSGINVQGLLENEIRKVAACHETIQVYSVKKASSSQFSLVEQCRLNLRLVSGALSRAEVKVERVKNETTEINTMKECRRQICGEESNYFFSHRYKGANASPQRFLKSSLSFRGHRASSLPSSLKGTLQLYSYIQCWSFWHYLQLQYLFIPTSTSNFKKGVY